MTEPAPLPALAPLPEGNVTASIAVKLPDFWKTDPVMWFSQAKAQFHLAKIVNNETKFYHIVAKVDHSVICHIADLVAVPPADNKYKTVKDRLIARFALSAENRFEQLLGIHDLGDMRPAHLLAKMRELPTGLGVDNNLLRMIFIQRLPANIRQILTCHDGSIEKLAEMADKITDATNNHASAVAAVNNESTSNPNSERKLVEQIEMLTVEIRRLKVPKSNRGRSLSRNRSGSRSSSRSGMCWYHRTYGTNAQRCREPCS
ncbi:uncharacterized protein LOC129766635 [Toxorhynchites rutilus septentrionalis]|uniref:uncharacterized protein LOC129766635 n=1 Tax=Toxorhynchites rutilus septentrionalis TaxID=329112 RepID=UPI00247A2A11|nr:uncharacterized protein LOC129766635 [Toxorhynchites rutilus septentrionalis]